jgi:DNA-binding NarL/FixJ family response regulator
MGIFIISAVRLYREGLALCLERRGDLFVVGTAAPGEVALTQFDKSNVGVVVLDMATVGGLATAKQLNQLLPGINVIAFGVRDADEDLIACAEAGVAGYVVQDGSIDDLVAAITAALNGEILCSPRFAGLLFRRLAILSKAIPEMPLQPTLTRREDEITGLLADGLSNKEIAQALRIEPATVKNHVHRILEKFQVRRRGEAAARWRTTSHRCDATTLWRGSHAFDHRDALEPSAVLNPKI